MKIRIRIRNKWNYQGSGKWKWEAFLDDDGRDTLNRINFVEYILHPTFKNPVRITHDKSNRFKIKTKGWGEFNLKAIVHLKGGDRLKLNHYITLKKNPSEGVSN